MRFGQTSLRWTGVPLLSCVLVVLLPGAAAAAPAPGVRSLPRAVSSPGPYADPAVGGADRLAGRLPDVLADGRGHPEGREGRDRSHGPYATGLPLPPLYGHHDHHDTDRRTRVTHGARWSAEREGGTPSPDRPGRRAAVGGADGTDGQRRPDAHAAPRTDARDGSGGDSSPAPASPSPSASPQPQDRSPSPEAAQAQPWSPAPVAPQDADRTVAGGAEPGPRHDLPAGTGPSAGTAPNAGTEPAAGTGEAHRAAPAAARAPAGPIVPVLPLGAGLASLGLGLAFLALRLRRG